MQARSIALLLVLASSFRLLSADPGDAAGREAQLAAVALAKQNEVLRAEIGRLREEVAKLTIELAQKRALLDEAKVTKLGAGQPITPSYVARGGAESLHAYWKLTDVNPDLKLVVMDVGKSGGVKQGMLLHALRAEKPAARLRVVDVREQMSGAVIEEILGSGSPEKGDRVVLMTAPK